MPCFTFFYEKPGFNTLFPIVTNALDFVVDSIKIDTNSSVHDIKPIIPLNGKNIWIYILIIIFITSVIMYFIIRQIRKNRIRKPKITLNKDIVPNIPPFVFAFNKLKYIEKEKLWLSDKKHFYSSLTEVIRSYIESTFNIKALEIPSSDLLKEMQDIKIQDDSYSKAKSLFETADLAKFAKYSPNDTECVDALAKAFEVLNLLNNESKGKEL